MSFKLVFSLHRNNHVGFPKWGSSSGLDGDQSSFSHEKKIVHKSISAHRKSKDGNPVADLFKRGLRGNGGVTDRCGNRRPESADERDSQQQIDGCGSSRTLHNGSGEQLPLPVEEDPDAGGGRAEEEEEEPKKKGELRRLFARLLKPFGRRERKNSARREPVRAAIFWRRSVETIFAPLADPPCDHRRASGGSLESVRSAERLGVMPHNSIAVRDIDGHLIEVFRRLSDEELKVGRATKVEMTETERDRNSVSGRVTIPGKISHSLEKITEQEPIEEESLPELAVTAEQGTHTVARRRCSLESGNLNTISE